MALIGGGLRANDSLSILLVLVFILAGLISILVHELGHALTVRKFGSTHRDHTSSFRRLRLFSLGTIKSQTILPRHRRRSCSATRTRPRAY